MAIKTLFAFPMSLESSLHEHDYLTSRDPLHIRKCLLLDTKHSLGVKALAKCSRPYSFTPQIPPPIPIWSPDHQLALNLSYHSYPLEGCITTICIIIYSSPKSCSCCDTQRNMLCTHIHEPTNTHDRLEYGKFCCLGFPATDGCSRHRIRNFILPMIK